MANTTVTKHIRWDTKHLKLLVVFYNFWPKKERKSLFFLTLIKNTRMEDRDYGTHTQNFTVDSTVEETIFPEDLTMIFHICNL